MAWIYNVQNNTIAGNNYIASVGMPAWLRESGSIPEWNLTSRRGEDGSFRLPDYHARFYGTALGAYVYYKVLGNRSLKRYLSDVSEDIKIGTVYGEAEYRSMREVKEAALEAMNYLLAGPEGPAREIWEPTGAFLEYQLSEYELSGKR